MNVCMYPSKTECIQLDDRPYGIVCVIVALLIEPLSETDEASPSFL